MVSVSENGRYLTDIFGVIPNALFKAANLNMSYDNTQTHIGFRHAGGNYDGIIGLLERNECDFAVYPIPSEILLGSNSEIPVKILSFSDIEENRILTHPTYNRTAAMVHHNIEDSLKEIPQEVAVFYLSISVIVWLVVRWRGGEDAKNKIIWKISAMFLNQTTEIPFKSFWRKIFLISLSMLIGILLNLFSAFLNADLVTYEKPELINSLINVWNAGDSVNISFLEAISIHAVFEGSPEGSLKKKLFNRAFESWSKVDKNNLMFLPSNRLIDTHKDIKKYNLALMTSRVPMEMYLMLECSDPKLESSELHVSSDIIHSYVRYHVASKNISNELEERLFKYHRRLTQSGIQKLMNNKAAEWTIFKFSNTAPRPSCLNTKVWSDETNKPFFGLEFKFIKTFFLHTFLTIFPILLVLYFEHIYHIHKCHKRHRVSIVEHSIILSQETRRSIFGEQNTII